MGAWPATAAAAVLLVGCAIKVADAAADGERPCRPAAAASWALLLTGLAAALQPHLAASLAVAAWSLGMLHPRAGQAPRPAARWEGAWVALLGAWLVGPAELLWSLSVLAAVQLVDDGWDRCGSSGSEPGHAGGWRGFLAVGLVAGCAWWYPQATAWVMGLTPLAERFGRWLAGRSELWPNTRSPFPSGRWAP